MTVFRRYKNIGLPFICIGILFYLAGCGEGPSAPPDVEFGALEVWAYYDSALVDTIWEWIPVDTCWVTLDDEPASTVYDAIPVLVEGILPGLHNVYVEWGDYNKSFSTQIFPGQTTVKTTFLTIYAPEFSADGLHYDPTQADSLAWIEDYQISDHWGEVIVLFYFAAT